MSRRATASTTAWLESIELENVRCFQERQTIPFTTRDGKKAQWTLLLGENGTGKSTLLQVCAAWMQKNWQAQGARLLFYFFKPQATNRSSNVTLSLHQLGAAPRWSKRILVRSGSGISDKDENSLPNKNYLTPPLCLAYAPYRSAKEFLPANTEPDGVEGILSGFTRLRHPGQWFQDRSFAAVNPDSDKTSKKVAQSILHRVRETLLNVLPEVIDLRIETEQEGRGANSLQAKTPYGWVNVDQLGFGYQSILALVVDIASRLVEHNPDSPNPLAEPAVILIDEVDLHLHPKWQRTLQKELSEQFPNAQFIATAHSPLVVQSSPDANVLLLKRDGDHVIVERAPDVIKTWRVDQILTSDLFGLPTSRPPHLDELIQHRDEILGKSELTEADEQRLQELDEQIGALPGGETPWQMKAMALISKAAKELETKRPSPTKKNAARASTRRR